MLYSFVKKCFLVLLKNVFLKFDILKIICFNDRERRLIWVEERRLNVEIFGILFRLNRGRGGYRGRGGFGFRGGRGRGGGRGGIFIIFRGFRGGFRGGRGGREFVDFEYRVSIIICFGVWCCLMKLKMFLFLFVLGEYFWGICIIFILIF